MVKRLIGVGGGGVRVGRALLEGCPYRHLEQSGLRVC